jgi:hypothetical protein
MKSRVIILASAIFFIFNLVLAGDPGPPKEKEWKGKGEKIEFQSMPILTIKDFLNGVVPEKRNTIWGNIEFFS